MHREQGNYNGAIIYNIASPAVITYCHDCCKFFKPLRDWLKRISTCSDLMSGKKQGLPSPETIYVSGCHFLASILYFFEVSIAIVCFTLTDLITKAVLSQVS